MRSNDRTISAHGAQIVGWTGSSESGSVLRQRAHFSPVADASESFGSSVGSEASSTSVSAETTSASRKLSPSVRNSAAIAGFVGGYAMPYLWKDIKFQ